MKIFISWSGERSKEVAELFRWWLKCVIQACDPWISTEDIESGSFWFNEISTQLGETSVGIICLTQENKDKPWILFEAGALTKGLSTSRVIPFLIDLQPHEIYPPLSQLNATNPTEKGLFSLVRTINIQFKHGQLAPDVLKAVFDTYWPQFQAKFLEILDNVPEHQKTESRKDKDILSEILLTVRSFDKRIRNIENHNPSDLTKIVNISKGELTNQEKIQLKSIVRNYVEKNYKISGKLPTVQDITKEIDLNILDHISFATLERMIITEMSLFKKHIDSL